MQVLFCIQSESSLNGGLTDRLKPELIQRSISLAAGQLFNALRPTLDAPCALLHAPCSNAKYAKTKTNPR